MGEVVGLCLLFVFIEAALCRVGIAHHLVRCINYIGGHCPPYVHPRHNEVLFIGETDFGLLSFVWNMCDCKDSLLCTTISYIVVRC